MAYRCSECSFLVAPEVRECPRCSADISNAQVARQWVTSFVVIFFLLGIGVFTPLAFVVAIIIDRAGYVVPVWAMVITGPLVVMAFAVIVTMIKKGRGVPPGQNDGGGTYTATAVDDD